MKDAHEEDADAQGNGSHQVEVASHGFLNLGDLVGAVLPGVVLAEGLELLVDPGQAGVKSGGDGDEASKGGLCLSAPSHAADMPRAAACCRM